jgi:methionyl-tRNA formyltransferase
VQGRTTHGGSGRVAVVGAVHESLPMLRGLLADPRAEVVAVVTVAPDDLPNLSGHVDLAAVAGPLGVPVFSGLDLGSAAALDILGGLDLDLMVVVGWTRLVPGSVLTLPRYGCVGFHASLLPFHRGRAPVNWSIIRGETETGTTMLMLDAGTDTGPIVDRCRLAISPDDTCGTVYERVADAEVEMLLRHLPALLTGQAPRHLQVGGGDLLPRRTPEMGITDWSRTSREIHDWIRGLTHPYPGAFSNLEGRGVRLWRATMGPDLQLRPMPPPGAILGCFEGGVLVAAGRGTVLLLSVEDDEDEGHGEQSAARWYENRGSDRSSAFDAVDRATSRWALGLAPAPAFTASRPMAAR